MALALKQLRSLPNLQSESRLSLSFSAPRARLPAVNVRIQTRHYHRQGLPSDYSGIIKTLVAPPSRPPSRSASTLDGFANASSTRQAKPVAPQVFTFPSSTLFTASTREAGLSQIPSYREALYNHGVAKIQCTFGEGDGDMEGKSALLLDIVNALGKADDHSATEGALWDIKNKPEGVISQGTGEKAVAISHTLDEFSWHIDGSFEDKPTRFFAFHIIHPDKRGGGIFRLLPVSSIVSSLPPAVIDILATKEFNIKVPPEFFKGTHTLKKPLLERPQNGSGSGQMLIRYRKGVCTAPEGDEEAKRAIAVLESLLEGENTGFAVSEEHFREDTLLLLDNRRFLHSRTSIQDPNRWLRRVRFHADSAAA